MFETWDDVKRYYIELLEQVPPLDTRTRLWFVLNLVDNGYGYNMLKMLPFIEQVKTRETFSNLTLSQWHTGLRMAPKPKRTKVSVWYKFDENAYFIFLDHPIGDQDDERKMVPEKDLILTLEDYLARVRTSDKYK
jgi:hypothetical protein